MTVREQIRALLQRHCTTIKAQVEEVEAALSGVVTSEDHQAASIRVAQGLTHQIKGTSGSMGYRETSAAAATLDQTLKALLTDTGSISPAQLQHALDLLRDLQRHARNASPEASSLYSADLPRLEK